MKDGYKYEKSKAKKVKRTIPAWASVTANKNIPVTNFAGTQNKVDNILIEAITVCTNPASAYFNRASVVTTFAFLFLGVCVISCLFSLQSTNDRSGVSFQSVMKYMLKNYPGMELNKKKFLIKKAMKKHLEKGTIKQVKDVTQCYPLLFVMERSFKMSFYFPGIMPCLLTFLSQLKGKGLSGTFAIGKQLPQSKVRYIRGDFAFDVSWKKAVSGTTVLALKL